MSLQISRKGKLYIKKEASYNETGITPASADAVRHIDFGMTYDPFNKVTSQEKKQSPGAATRFTRQPSASWDLRQALIRPSGTLNTVPEADEIFEAAFGSRTNVTLSTTVASGGGATGATLTSTTGLVVGGPLAITQGGLIHIVIIQTLPGANAVTWLPALPSGTLANASVVKSAIKYVLTTDLAISLGLYHILSNFSRLGLGAGVDKLTLKVQANEEGMLSASGPMAQQLTAGLPAAPGAFTTVGGNPPSGITGALRIGSGAYLHKSIQFDLANALAVRNVEANTDGLPTELYREGRREVGIALQAFAETEATIYDLAEAGTLSTLMRQVGRTEGNIWAVWCPNVEWKVPGTSDGDGPADWDIKGTALESSVDANDEISLIFA